MKKYKCVGYLAAESFFTKGKIYELNQNGYIMNDRGYVYNCAPFDKGHFLNSWHEFEEVKENQVIYRLN